MGIISFRKIKLFKSSEIVPRRPQPLQEAPADEEGEHPEKKIVRNPILILILFVTALSLVITYVPRRSLPVPAVGEIASEDIIAPSNLTIEDHETTAKRRTQAEQSVLPVYVFDPSVFPEVESRIRKFFDAGRDRLESGAVNLEEFGTRIQEDMGIEIPTSLLATTVKTKFPQDLEEALVNIIGKVTAEGVLLSKTLFIQGEAERGLTLLRKDGGEKTARVSDLMDIKEAKGKIGSEIDDLDLSSRNKSLLGKLADIFVTPNIAYNKAETESRRERARMGVEPVFYTIKKTRVIVRKGDEVSADAAKQIRLINLNLRQKPSWFTNFAGTFLLFGLLFITLWYYLKSLLRSENALMKFVMMGVTLFLSLVVYRLSLFLAAGLSEHASLPVFTDSGTYQYAFAFQAGVLIFAFLTTDNLALIFTVLNSLIAGYVLGPDFYTLIYSLVGGVAAIYGVKVYQRQRRTATLKSGLFFVGPTNVFVIIAIHLIREKLGGLSYMGVDSLMGLIGGALSAGLAFVLLPVFETLFRFVTSAKLLELMNSDLPIFRQMSLETPGSYHHSLIVATLAEKAAEEIKANPMLAKAGGLYHDIGKIKMPEYFIENRSRELDIHKDLTPSLSTLVIVNHVKEGLEMARKLKLPQRLQDIIEQHHGTSIVRYFYQKAKEKYDPELHKVGEEDYRYPGPRPRSKEAGLVLLADSVEAASRSLRTPTKDSLKRLITDIFNNYLQDGQLEDCDFTLKELRIAAATFFNILYAVCHPRVEYPGFGQEIRKPGKNRNPKKNNDRNNQPPAQTPPQPDQDRETD